MNSNQLLKVIFGVVVFLFSLTLAYFAAGFMDDPGNVSKPLDFWLTMAIMGGFYIVAGILLAQIFSVSLGFLFSADLLILSALANNFGEIDEIYKVALVGIIIAILYTVAFTRRSQKVIEVRPPSPVQQ